MEFEKARDSSVDDSARRPNPVFLVGCQRSGTTWLQTLLSHHPAVATAPETDVVAGYLSLLDRRWCFEKDYREQALARTGLQELISDERFYGVARSLAEEVFEAVLWQKPGSSVVLEKTPHNVLYARLVLRLFPGARFIHLIRDPRAVVSSLRAAASGWGAHWAEKGTVSGARRWYQHVHAGLEIPELTDCYKEIHYETLRADPVNQLQGLFDWLELPINEKACRDYVQRSDIDKLRTAPAEEQNLTPSDNAREFYRRGESGGWRCELSATDVAIVERVAGPLLERAGYQRVSSLGPQYRILIQPRVALRLAMKRLVEGAQWRINRVLMRWQRSL